MTPITSSVPSTSTTTPTSSVASALNNNTEIASNFTTFLQLLTTQLQNQDPLSPMDTNQFTQQLVEFASVEQQMKSNDSLTTLVSLEQAAQSTQALALVGATVVAMAPPRRPPMAKPIGASTSQSRRPRLSPSRTRPARPPIPVPSASIRALRISPGTATPLTAPWGRTAPTP